MSKPPVLVSFASKGREDYNQKLLRLLDSAVQHWKGDYLICSPDSSYTEYKGIPITRPELLRPNQIPLLPHATMPYQFKVALIARARELGYTKIVWLDSGMNLQKDITPLFEHKTGITVFHNLGHPLYKYMGDVAQEILGVTDEELQTIPQIWGGALFLNFEKKNAQKVFEQIAKASLNGSFKDGGSTREGFIAHRHDQAVMSVLVHGKCNMLPYGNIVCPPHDVTGEYGRDFYLVSK